MIKEYFHFFSLENRQKKKSDQSIKLNILGEKISWFKEQLLPDVTVYTPDQVDELLQVYLNRFDEELEQITIKHSIGGRKNRQHASREDIIRLNQKMELQEYKTCGIEIPDLLNTQQLKYLRNWDGELRFIQNFKLRRIGKPLLDQLREKENKQNDENKDSTLVTVEGGKSVDAIESTNVGMEVS